MSLRAVVFSSRPGDRYRSARTVRSLRAAGVACDNVCDWPPAALGEALSARGSVWLVRAGAWPVVPRPLPPPPSATGLPLAALGVVVPGSDCPRAEAEARAWQEGCARHGGDFSENPSELPAFASVYLDHRLTAGVAGRLRDGEALISAVSAELREQRPRLVHHAALDVRDDEGLRVIQVVTSLQRGGAERVAVTLTEELRRHGVRCLLATLGRPTREAFAAPSGTVDLSTQAPDRARRLRPLYRLARDFAADLVHGHLLDGDEAARLAAAGLPVVLTIHNTRAGWPAGLAGLRSQDAAMLFACSRAVEDDLRSDRIPIATRIVWNGIDFARCVPTAAAPSLREPLGLGPDDFVLLSLANPRPQKRLDQLPAVLAAVRAELARRGIPRLARLLLAGETAQLNESARDCVRRVRAEVERLGLADAVSWLGAVEDVGSVLRAADVLISTSVYEGLSLAHLEALAAGRPLVVTAAGGTAEIAHGNPAVHVLPLDAAPERFAAVLADLATTPRPEAAAIAARDFSHTHMARRHVWLYPRVLEAARGRRRGSGVWLVTNNFSTGGAQSSARRLLTGFARQGVRVRAAVLEEQPEYPTPGRKSLIAAGIPVLALPPAGTLDAAEAVGHLLEAMDADPPQAVLLWNVLAEYKVLLADALLDVSVFDVSPGEMYFASLERYFTRPRPGLPYRTPAEYGERLAGIIVKYTGEAERAAALGCPVHVIANGVCLDGTPPAVHAPKSRLVIGTAARLSPQKKLEQLLEAVRRVHDRLPPFVLRIAGGGERGGDAYVEELRRLADGLPVEWVGEEDDVRPFLRELDLFAMISEPAGCSNASLEAMAAGLPIVATDVGGAAEQVVDGITGRLVPRGSVQDFGEALLELTHDRGRRERYGAAGQDRVRRHFSVERMLTDYRRVCLVDSGGGTSANG
jgi:glycosyltransferase involved in cell wall biosynthesis